MSEHVEHRISREASFYSEKIQLLFNVLIESSILQAVSFVRITKHFQQVLRYQGLKTCHENNRNRLKIISHEYD